MLLLAYIESNRQSFILYPIGAKRRLFWQTRSRKKETDLGARGRGGSDANDKPDQICSVICSLRSTVKSQIRWGEKEKKKKKNPISRIMRRIRCIPVKNPKRSFFPYDFQINNRSAEDLRKARGKGHCAAKFSWASRTPTPAHRWRKSLYGFGSNQEPCRIRVQNKQIRAVSFLMVPRETYQNPI